MGSDGIRARQGEPDPVDLHYGHPRMPLSERAKIFSPFDTLKGFREALAEQERKVLEGFQDSEPDDAAEW